MNKEIKTDNFIISENSPAYIIAEIGINHGGDVEVAKCMVKQAYNSGAECIKHQTHFVDPLPI